MRVTWLTVNLPRRKPACSLFGCVSKTGVEEAFHELVLHAEDGDGAVSLGIVQRVIWFGESDHFGAAPDFRQLRPVEILRTEEVQPLNCFRALVQDELLVNVIDSRDLAR